MPAHGRRMGFQLGAVFGLLSTLLTVYAIFALQFWLFCLALFVSGWYQACAQYYRFAAADTASLAFRPTAISWVLAGGLVAAVAGPLPAANPEASSRSAGRNTAEAFARNSATKETQGGHLYRYG